MHGLQVFSNSQRDVFNVSIGSNASSYCISTIGDHIILKEYIKLTTVQKGIYVLIACDSMAFKLEQLAMEKIALLSLVY